MTPRKLGCCTTTARTCRSQRRAGAARSVRAVAPARDHGGRAAGSPWRLGGQHAGSRGCTPRQDDDAPRACCTRAARMRRFRQRRGAVVHRGVAHVHAGELADRRLELEDDLQPPWLRLGLVGRVRREELGAARHGVDDGRDVGVVHAGARNESSEPARRVAAGQAPSSRSTSASAAGSGRSRRPSKRTSAGWSRTARRACATPTAASISRTSCARVRHEPHGYDASPCEELLVGGGVHEAVELGTASDSRTRISQPWP